MDVHEYIGQMLDVVVDQPLGSKHPQFEWHYPANYGYVADIISDDGEEFDAYVLGVTGACDEFSGMCIAAIKREGNPGYVLIIVPEGVEYDDDEIMEMIHFQEKYFDIDIIR